MAIERFNQTLSVTEEVRIVALLANNDYTYPQIQKIFESEFGRGLSQKAIQAVKKRNAKNLEAIKTKLMVRQEADALAIKHQANMMIQKRLTADDKVGEIIAAAQKQFLAGEIPLKEYVDVLRTNRPIAVTELVTVSKEMHAQSKDDDTPDVTKKDLSALVSAIKSGDELVLNQLIFKAGDGSDKHSSSTGEPIPSI